MGGEASAGLNYRAGDLPGGLRHSGEWGSSVGAKSGKHSSLGKLNKDAVAAGLPQVPLVRNEGLVVTWGSGL